jgi:hypothetical protein
LIMVRDGEKSYEKQTLTPKVKNHAWQSTF